MAAEARLESDRILIRRDAGLLDKGGNRLETLRAVTGRVGWTVGLATILEGQAMRAGGVRLAQVTLRHAMETEEQMLIISGKKLPRPAHQGGNVQRLVKIRRLDAHPDARSEFG